MADPEAQLGRSLIAIPSPTVEILDVHVLNPERRLLPARVRLFIDTLVEERA